MLVIALKPVRFAAWICSTAKPCSVFFCKPFLSKFFIQTLQGLAIAQFPPVRPYRFEKKPVWFVAKP